CLFSIFIIYFYSTFCFPKTYKVLETLLFSISIIYFRHPTLVTLSAVEVLYPPIKTVNSPNTIVPPCAVLSPNLAAGIPPIKTEDEPIIIESGGPAQVAISPTLAAGIPPISTVGSPAGRIGPPTCGLPFGFTIGQMCISFILAAGGITLFFSFLCNFPFFGLGDFNLFEPMTLLKLQLR